MGWREGRANVLRTHQPARTADDGHQDNARTDGDSFDSAHWRREIESLAEVIGRVDPHGVSWEWIRANRSDGWGRLMTVMREIDTAFEERNAGQLRQSLARARSLYLECVRRWESDAG